MAAAEETEEAFQAGLAAETEEAFQAALAEIDLQEVAEIMTIGSIPIQEGPEEAVILETKPETEVALEVINPEVVLVILEVTIAL